MKQLNYKVNTLNKERKSSHAVEMAVVGLTLVLIGLGAKSVSETVASMKSKVIKVTEDPAECFDGQEYQDVQGVVQCLRDKGADVYGDQE
jgi:hypothetical protein